MLLRNRGVAWFFTGLPPEIGDVRAAAHNNGPLGYQNAEVVLNWALGASQFLNSAPRAINWTSRLTTDSTDAHEYNPMMFSF
jgi:hypothetical protein